MMVVAQHCMHQPAWAAHACRVDEGHNDCLASMVSRQLLLWTLTSQVVDAELEKLYKEVDRRESVDGSLRPVAGALAEHMGIGLQQAQLWVP